MNLKKTIVKYISVSLSAILLFCNVFSNAVFAAKAGGEAGVTATYYVQYGGTGDGLGEGSPIATVDDAVKAAKAAGLGTGDTVYVNVMQSADWNYGAGTIGAGDNYRADDHHITTWAARGAMTNHDFKLVVEGYEGNSVYLASNGKLGYNLDMILGGDTEFKNITIVRMRRWRGLLANGYDVSYDEHVSFGCVNVDDCDSTFQTWDGTINKSDGTTALALGNANIAPEGKGGTVEIRSEAPQFTVNVSSLTDVWVGGSRTGPSADVENYGNDVTVILNNSKTYFPICMGNQYGGGTYFGKNLNLNLKSVGKSEYKKGDGSVTVNGNLQIISSYTGMDITDLPNNITVNGGKWFITNKGAADLLSFTDTAGTYAVNNENGAVAIDLNDGQKVYYSENGLLTIPAGKYSVLSNNSAMGEATYYVQYGGNGSGITEDSPLASVEDAVKAANDAGFGFGNTVRIKVMQSADWNYGAGTIGAGDNNRADAHHITTWAARGAMTSHKFKLIVEGYGEGDVYLASNGQLGLNLDMVMGGPTEFSNITIVRMRRWRGIYANGYDLKFGEGTKVGTINVDDCDSTFNVWNGNIDLIDGDAAYGLGNVKNVPAGGGGTTVFANATASSTVVISSFDDIWVGSTPTGPSSDTEIYSNDTTIVFDNKNLTVDVALGNRYGGETEFEKNLNINAKKVGKITFNSTDEAGNVFINGDLQVIAKSGVRISEIADNDNVVVDGKEYYLSYTGGSGILDFTDVSGKYKVKDGITAIATDLDDSSKTYISVNGILTVPAGRYSVSRLGTGDAEVTYYVKYGGNGDGLTPESPFSTVADAISAANDDELAEGDKIYVYVMQPDDWQYGADTIGAGGNDSDPLHAAYYADLHHMTYWGPRGVVPLHKATLIVEGYGDDNAYLATSERLGYNVDMLMGGPTEFKNISIIRTRRWRGLFANGYDVKYGEGTVFGCVNVDECDKEFKTWGGSINFEDENTTFSLGNIGRNSGELPAGGGGRTEINCVSAESTVVVSSITDFWEGSVQTGGPESDVEDYKKSVTLVFNHPSLVTTVEWGNKEGGSTLFEKSFNISVKEASEIKQVSGLGNITINGGFQVISCTNVADFTSLPDNVTINGGKWFITNNGKQDLIDFTDDSGRFSVAYGSRAIATNVNTGRKYTSVGGILTIPAGTYTVEEYDKNDGNTDLKDFVRLKKFFSGTVESVGSFADYNSDGSINIDDFGTVANHLLGYDLALGGTLEKTAMLSGGADQAANELRKAISSAPDTIRATKSTYYVSSSGSDSNAGTSADKPLKTVYAVSKLKLYSGDAVLFKRGDTFRVTEELSLVSGVSYGAYGTGEKPIISGSLKDYSNPSLWESDDSTLWKTSLNANEAGNIEFNGGEYIGVRKPRLEEVKTNGDYYLDTESKYLYLYLRENNPGSYFDSIEIASTETLFVAYRATSAQNIKIENLSFKYAAEFALSIRNVKNCTVTGCEFGWIGGGYTNSYNQRYGNAVEVWVLGIGCNISNNYIYQTYDAALTFQGTDDNTYRNLTFENNLVEYCAMNFEFWAQEKQDNGSIDPVEFTNIKFRNNILRFSGYGFGGTQRAKKSGQAFVLAWAYQYDSSRFNGFDITGNTFDCADTYYFYGPYVLNYINISGNSYYQRGSCKFAVSRGMSDVPQNLEEFSAGIRQVDSNPKYIGWIDE